MGGHVRHVAAHIFSATLPFLAIIFQALWISQVKPDDIGLTSVFLKGLWLEVNKRTQLLYVTEAASR